MHKTMEELLGDVDSQILKTVKAVTPKKSPQAEVWGKAAMQLMQRGAARRRAREAAKK